MSELSGYVAGPRWMDIEGEFRRACAAVGIEVVSLHRGTHFMRQTITYRVRGESVDISALASALKDYER